jgi:hypothetical protein
MHLFAIRAAKLHCHGFWQLVELHHLSCETGWRFGPRQSTKHYNIGHPAFVFQVRSIVAILYDGLRVRHCARWNRWTLEREMTG